MSKKPQGTTCFPKLNPANPFFLRGGKYAFWKFHAASSASRHYIGEKQPLIFLIFFLKKRPYKDFFMGEKNCLNNPHQQLAV